MTRFDWQHGLGAVSADEFIEQLRKEIYAGCSKSPTKFMSRKRATKRLEEDACIAIAYTYSKFNPDRTYIVKKDWPRAFAIITKTEDGTGYEAVIEPWLGPDCVTSLDGIEPVRVPVEWGKQPANVIARIKNALPWSRKPVEEPLVLENDLAPVGTPDGRPNTKHARADSQMTQDRVSAPAATQPAQTRQTSPVTPPSPARTAMAQAKPTPAGVKPAQRPPAKR